MPCGVEHRPVAEGEVHAVLIEPVGVINTGDAGGPLTADFDALSHSAGGPTEDGATGAESKATEGRGTDSHGGS